MNLEGTARDVLRRVRRRLSAGADGSGEQQWYDVIDAPWGRLPAIPPAVLCNVCGWMGGSFEGVAHSESSLCPRCGSIGRDRFLIHSLCSRVPASQRLRLLETSPRMGEGYRTCMSRWFDYTASDFDERAHKGSVQIDLQAIDLPTASLDVLMTAHVLEHVPQTDDAVAEMRRVVRPGGWLVLQVPLLQAHTAPPETPEFHGDDTPVFWRFGFDLTERLRSHGFATELLCTEGMYQLVRSGATRWPDDPSPEFDADALVRGAIEADLAPVLTNAAATRLGLDPAYMYFTWVGRRD